MLPPLLDGDAIYWPRELTESHIEDLYSHEEEKKRSAQNEITEKCEEMFRQENYEAVSKIQHELIFEGYHEHLAIQLKQALDNCQYEELSKSLKLIDALQLHTDSRHHNERVQYRDGLASMHMAKANKEILIETATSTLPPEKNRLEAIDSFSKLARYNWKMQLEAMKKGFFGELFKLLESSNKARENEIISVLENLVHCNFRLQKWLHENRPDLFLKVWTVLNKADPDKAPHPPITPFETHIKDFDKQIFELNKKIDEQTKPRATGDGDHGFIGDTVSLVGREQVGGACYAYACARSFIHR